MRTRTKTRKPTENSLTYPTDKLEGAAAVMGMTPREFVQQGLEAGARKGEVVRITGMETNGDTTIVHYTARKKPVRKPRQITVVVKGKDYRRLEVMAKALNKVSWLDHDNTASTIFWNFVFPWAQKDMESLQELADDIESGIDLSPDLADAPEELKAKREAELKAVLDEVRKVNI